MKKRGGFSYIEVIIAASLLAILVMAVLPLLVQASRNMALAQNAYSSHLAAQSIMLAVRDTLENTSHELDSAQQAAQITAARLGNVSYSVWIIRTVPPQITFATICAPTAYVDIPELSDMLITPNSAAVIVVVWNEYGNPAGRAIGFANGA